MNAFNRPNQKTYLIAYATGLIFFISVMFNLVEDNGRKNLHVHQAKAFVQGKLDIDEPVNDTAFYDNKYYVTFPPFPAMVLTPMVALFGWVNTTLIALLLTGVLIAVLWSLFQRLGMNSHTRLWLIMAFVFGTGYWFVVKFSSGVWSFAHVVAVLMLFLSIREAFGRGRAWLIALLLGCAFLSRQLAIYSAVFLLAVLIERSDGNVRKMVKDVIVFGLVFFVFILIYLWLNYLRFDDALNTGYYYIAGDPMGLLGEKRYGLFHYHYVPFNFIYMFLQGPHVEFDGLMPVGMDFFGTSITFASPFVFLAFKARGARLIKAGAWTTIGLCLLHMLFYCNNGWIQVNTQRFTLDFLPVLMVLVTMAIHERNKKLFRITVIAAVVLNIVSFVGISFLIR